MTETESGATSMAQVHAAWLAAGAESDVLTMARLRTEYPEWLDLEKAVGPGLVDNSGSTSSSAPARFCGWTDFHLPTIGASALHTAAWESNFPVLELMLEAGQNPDTPDNSGMTPIMVVILRYSLVVTRCVIREKNVIFRNRVVDCREAEKQLEEKALATIAVLLRFGADVNAVSQETETALHCAAECDGLELARCLVDAGANIDAQNAKGRSPLHCCVKEDSLLVANLLLSCGTQIDLADADGVTPLEFTLQKQNLNMLQLFLNHHHMVATPYRHDFAAAGLHRAIELGSDAVVRFLIEDQYASVTTCNDAGETPLHRAIVLRQPQIVELLLHLDPAGESLQTPTDKGEYPVHYAAQFGSQGEMKALLTGFSQVFGDLSPQDETNPLNTLDHRGLTGLYLAGTMQAPKVSPTCGKGTADNTRDREIKDAKVQLLLQHGARLFSARLVSEWIQPVAPDSPPSNAQLLLPVQIRRCLGLWVVEDENRGDKHLTTLCITWLASLESSKALAGVLPVVITAGYARETLALLLELPLRRAALPDVLLQVERFAEHSGAQDLLMKLHTEVTEAWLAEAPAG